jgi:hypothetical protein
MIWREVVAVGVQYFHGSVNTKLASNPLRPCPSLTKCNQKKPTNSGGPPQK